MAVLFYRRHCRQRWSEARLTTDVDLTLLTGFGREEEFIDKLLGRFSGRIPDAREFALRNRVVLLASPDKIGMDVALSGFPFEESAVRHATDFEFLPGVRLRTCSAEDLIVFKAFAGRPLDWHDVKMAITRQGESNLDWTYIDRELTPLCELKGHPEVMRQLKKLRLEVAKKAASPGASQ